MLIPLRASASLSATAIKTPNQAALPCSTARIFLEKNFLGKRDSHLRRLGADKDQVPLPDKGIGGGGTTFRCAPERASPAWLAASVQRHTSLNRVGLNSV